MLLVAPTVKALIRVMSSNYLTEKLESKKQFAKAQNRPNCVSHLPSLTCKYRYEVKSFLNDQRGFYLEARSPRGNFQPSAPVVQHRNKIFFHIHKFVFSNACISSGAGHK